MHGVIKCPYCEAINRVDIPEADGWARPKCHSCSGVYYVEEVKTISATGFSNKGEDTEPTTESY